MPVIIADIQYRRIAEALQARQPSFPPAAAADPASHGPATRAPGDGGPLSHHWADLTALPGPIDATLARRRSVRTFAPDPVPATLVNATAMAARDAEAATWPGRSHGAATFEILIAAYRVSGAASGLYAGSVEAGPRLLRAETSWREWPALYADAPVLLLICGDLNGACRSSGAAGYPSMLVRAGTIGYGAWLWALSAGLACSVYACPSHQVTGAARQLDPNLRHLFTVALGIPAGEPAAAGSRGGMTAGSDAG